MDTLKKVQNFHKRLTATGSSAKKKKNEDGRVFVHDLDLFATVQLLDETLAIPLLHKFCSKRGNWYEQKMAKLYDWPKMGRQLLVQSTTQNFSLFQDCHHLPAAGCLQHRNQRNSPIIQELGTGLDPVITRSDKHADRCWQAGHGKPWTSKRDDQGRSNARHSRLVLQPFTVNLEDLEYMFFALSSGRVNSDSEGDASKVETQEWKHSVNTHFRKYRKCSIPWTEKHGDLTTAEHKSLSEGRESRNNHRYTVVVQVLATQWNACQTKTSQETEKNLWKFLQASMKL